MKSLIETIDLTKAYEDGLLALDVLNLRVEPKEIYCLLGANGAGKTTAVNILLNFIQPTSGRALINGIDVNKNPLEAKKHVAYVSENVMLYGNFTARQNLDFFAKLGGKHRLKKEDYYMVLREVGLQEKAFEQQVKKLSKGMRQKVGIAIAMIRDAVAIVLDEPTAGLDPKAVADFMDILSGLRERGKAILISTHDIFRAREIADRVGILKEGRKVLERTRKEFEQDDLQALYLDYMRGGYTMEVDASNSRYSRAMTPK
jgi:ABC-2 type transport system ATP-binding protein